MGKLYVVGIGCGNYDNMTIKADKVLKISDLIYCDEKASQILKKHIDPKKIIKNNYYKTFERCQNAIESAKGDKTVSVTGNGDTGIYGISSIILEQTNDISDQIELEIIPGVTSAISGAALLGSPLTKDFSIISLSKNFANSNLLKKEVEALAKLNVGLVFYSPCEKNLTIARNTLLKYLSPKTLVGIVENIGENNQNTKVITLNELSPKDFNSVKTIFVSRKESYLDSKKRIITPLYNGPQKR